TVGEAAGANPKCGRKSVLPLLRDAHYESIGLSRLSNAICVGDDFHLTHWHITPGDLFNVVDSVEACGVSGHVAMPLRTVRGSENQIQIVLQAGAGWVSPHQCRLDCLVRRSNRHRSRFLLTRVELFAVSLIPELHLTARRHNLPDVYTSKTLTIVRDTADLRRSILPRDSVGGVYDQGFEQSCTRIILAMGSCQIFAYDCDAACNQWSGHARAAIEEIERICRSLPAIIGCQSRSGRKNRGAGRHHVGLGTSILGRAAAAECCHAFGIVRDRIWGDRISREAESPSVSEVKVRTQIFTCPNREAILGSARRRQ